MASTFLKALLFFPKKYANQEKDLQKSFSKSTQIFFRICGNLFKDTFSLFFEAKKILFYSFYLSFIAVISFFYIPLPIGKQRGALSFESWLRLYPVNLIWVIPTKGLFIHIATLTATFLIITFLSLSIIQI